MLVTTLYKSEKVLFIKLIRSDSLLLLCGNQNSEGSSGMTATKYRPVDPVDSSCENGILMA
jgi:hypothetical protein